MLRRARSACVLLASGAAIGLAGDVLRGPAAEPLATYEVREQAGEIQVRV